MAQDPKFVYYHSNRTQPAPRPQPTRRSHRKLIALLCLALVGFVFIKASTMHANHVHAQEIAAAAAAREAQESAVVPKVQAVINGTPAVTFGVSIIDVQTGKATNIGVQTPYIAASTGKLLTAALFLHKVDLGQASLKQTIDGSSAQTWLKQMVVLSDNNAWANLNDYLTHEALTSYAETIGIHDYDTTNNMLAPHDIANLLQQLATGNLLKPASTQLFMSYLKVANYRASIVPAVPAQDTVYHKIGFLDDYLHDAAIIESPAGRKVVLVVYTNGNGTYDDDARNAAIQQITRAVIEGYL